MQQSTDVAFFPNYQLHLCKGNSGENQQLWPIIARFETHFVQSGSENEMPENRENILKFLLSNTLPIFSSITETIICLTRQHGVFANNLKTSSFGILSFSLFSWSSVWLKLFFVSSKSSMDSLASYVAHVWGEERLVCSKRAFYVLSSFIFQALVMVHELRVLHSPCTSSSGQ